MSTSGGANRHRAQPARPPGRPGHRATRVRPRYARLAVAGTALVVTALALLGGIGVLPGGDRGSDASATAGGQRLAGAERAAADATSTAPSATASATTAAPSSDATASSTSSTSASSATPVVATPPLPASSGEGRRIVFSQAQQRVWLVGTKGAVVRSYLVSGSTLDNLDPGSYQVYSRSRWAVGIQDSGVMQYFVRFTQGPTGAAIGFHTLPTSNGKPLQSKAQLGTPQSHGCIRQARADAIALWEFAPLKTRVDVVAA